MSEMRDTHFQGFAKLLWDELVELNKGGYIDVSSYFDDGIDPTNYRLLIAQRAYDFLVSSHFHAAMLATWEESKERVALVPDLTEWPTLDQPSP